MTKPSAKREVRIPINPFWVGGCFLGYCASQGWMLKEREGRRTRYCVTAAGVSALKEFGIHIRKPARAARPKKQARQTRTRPSP